MLMRRDKRAEDEQAETDYDAQGEELELAHERSVSGFLARVYP